MANRHRPDKLRFEQLEDRRMLAPLWQNPILPTDVNNDLSVSPLDALLVLNYLGRYGSGPPVQETNARFYDTNGNETIAPIDALIVLNSLFRDEPFVTLRFDAAEQSPLEFAGRPSHARTSSLEIASRNASRIDSIHLVLNDVLVVDRDLKTLLVNGRFKYYVSQLEKDLGSRIVDGMHRVRLDYSG
ncbi:MAG: dockerin type I domain-containing protein [Pirellulaceae bacterium]